MSSLLATVLSLMAAMFAALSAIMWFKAARIRFNPTKLASDIKELEGKVHINPPDSPLGVYVDGQPVVTQDQVIKFVEKSSVANSWAAFFTGIAAIFAALSVVASLL